MIGSDQVRQVALAEFMAFHQAEYTDLDVEYPNVKAVDVEHRTEDFVSVYFVVKDTPRLALGLRDQAIYAELWVYYHARVGTGISNNLIFGDKLRESLALLYKDGINYGECISTQVDMFEDWESNLHRLKITVVGGSLEGLC